jgi:hypothetical protein
MTVSGETFRTAAVSSTVSRQNHQFGDAAALVERGERIRASLSATKSSVARRDDQLSSSDTFATPPPRF